MDIDMDTNMDKDIDWKLIGAKIRHYRNKKKLTQANLATMIDVSSASISDIERGKFSPALSTFIKIANALEISADALLSDVLITGINIRASFLSDIINGLPSNHQHFILNMVEAMINNLKNLLKIS